MSYKPPTTDGLGFRKFDNETINVVRPTKIAGRQLWVLPANSTRYRIVNCNSCFLPALWVDTKIKGWQWNSCTHCNTWHMMIVEGVSIKTKKIKKAIWDYGNPYDHRGKIKIPLMQMDFFINETLRKR